MERVAVRVSTVPLAVADQLSRVEIPQPVEARRLHSFRQRGAELPLVVAERHPQWAARVIKSRRVVGDVEGRVNLGEVGLGEVGALLIRSINILPRPEVIVDLFGLLVGESTLSRA